jgi:hypothetical protein
LRQIFHSGAIIFGEVNNITEQIRKRLLKRGSVHAGGSEVKRQFKGETLTMEELKLQWQKLR